nr:4Fe-4S dicluster domain-containing protein [Dickeya sp. DW 0440]
MNQFVIANAKDCIGCKACEIACVISHNDGCYPQNRQDFHPRIKVFGKAEQHTAVTCRHCEDAPCASVCPTRALVKKQGGVQLLAEKCIGCKTCVLACPFGAISVETAAQSGTAAHKCDLCLDRPQGQACVEACPTKALHVVQRIRARRTV